MAKIKHTRNENDQNFTHQNKTTLFWRKKAKINLHQNILIYGNCLWNTCMQHFISYIHMYNTFIKAFIISINIKVMHLSQITCIYRTSSKVAALWPPFLCAVHVIVLIKYYYVSPLFPFHIVFVLSVTKVCMASPPTV